MELNLASNIEKYKTFSPRLWICSWNFIFQKWRWSKYNNKPSGWNLIADGLKCGYNSITLDSSLSYQDIEVVKGWKIETKIVYLVKWHPRNAYLQCDGKCGMCTDFKQINYSGNQTSSWIGLINIVDDVRIDSILCTSEILDIFPAKWY